MIPIYLSHTGKAFVFREEAEAEDAAPLTEEDLDHLYQVLHTYAAKAAPGTAIKSRIVDLMNELDEDAPSPRN